MSDHCTHYEINHRCCFCDGASTHLSACYPGTLCGKGGDREPVETPPSDVPSLRELFAMSA